ncbi:MAG: hypothetical protein A2Y10_10190 [Planctomycetes bacterium GWF2_41_51]|nr:MAG: hypothetical protein A2Y10_10190 [Planctomycetes bacterium GWF2_41_51]HBG27691.1 hypothetical protein [Phycisphaerales bacterium]
MVSLVHNAYGAVEFRDTTGDHLWKTAGNWYPTGVPGYGSGSVIIGGSNTCLIDSTTTAQTDAIYAGHSYRPAGTCYLNIDGSGSTLNVKGHFWLGASANGYNCTTSLTNGAFVKTAWVTASSYTEIGAASGSIGKLNITGASTVFEPYALNLGYSSGSNGQMYLYSGTVNFGGNLTIGRLGDGKLNLCGGSILNQAGSYNSIYMANATGTTCTLWMTNGLINTANGGLVVGNVGSATVTMDGGEMDLGFLWLGTAANPYSSGVVHLNGGLIKLSGTNLSVKSGSTLDITGGALSLGGTVTDITTYGNVTAYGGEGVFHYEYVSGPRTIVTALPVGIGNLWNEEAELSTAQHITFSGTTRQGAFTDPGRTTLIEAGGNVYAFFRQYAGSGNFEIYRAVSTDGGVNFTVEYNPC